MKHFSISVNNKWHDVRIFEDKDISWLYPILIVGALILFWQHHFIIPTDEKLQSDAYYTDKVFNSVYKPLYKKEKVYWESKGYEVNNHGVPNEYNDMVIEENEYKRSVEYLGNGIFEVYGTYNIRPKSGDRIYRAFYSEVYISPSRTILLYVDLNIEDPNTIYIEYEELGIILDTKRDEARETLLRSNLEAEREFSVHKQEYIANGDTEERTFGTEVTENGYAADRILAETNDYGELNGTWKCEKFVGVDGEDVDITDPMLSSVMLTFNESMSECVFRVQDMEEVLEYSKKETSDGVIMIYLQENMHAKYIVSEGYIILTIVQEKTMNMKFQKNI